MEANEEKEAEKGEVGLSGVVVRGVEDADLVRGSFLLMAGLLGAVTGGTGMSGTGEWRPKGRGGGTTTPGTPTEEGVEWWRWW